VSNEGLITHVALLSPSMEDGGVETYLRTLSAGMIARGVKVTVVLPASAEISGLRADLRAAGARVATMPYEWSSPQSGGQVVRQIVRDLLCMFRGVRTAERTRLLLMLPHPEFSP
jgi:hypothetical protein